MNVRLGFTRALLLAAALGAGGLAGEVVRARTAVRAFPVGLPDEPALLAEAGILYAGPLVAQSARGRASVGGGASVAGKGRAGAERPVLRIFGDYECPACQALEREAGDTLRALAAGGAVTVMYHHSPLRTHWRGASAAAVSYCAESLGRGPAVHRELQRSVADWTAAEDPVAALIDAAARAGADADSVAACMRDGRSQGAVRSDRRLADALGVRSVPAIFLDETRLDFRSYRALVRHVAKHVASG